ncbi:MAG: M56 family metallopeptidase [Pirellulales bacterium]
MNYLSIFEVLASLFVQVSVLIGLTAWITRHPRLRSDADACWSVAHVCILLLTAAAFFLPHVRWITWVGLTSSERPISADGVMMLVGGAVSWVWLAGVIAVSLLCCGGMLRATSLVRRASVDHRIAQIRQEGLDISQAELPQTGFVETRVSPDDVSPFCWQFHRPVIVLPERVRHFPRAEQVAILRHEQAHLCRQHPLHLFLQRMVEAIYWFHPAVWWASKQAAAAREFRCDRDSVRSRGEVVDYLRSLLRLIESKLHQPARLPAGIGFMGSASLLKQRAQLLGDYVESAEMPTQSTGAPRLVAICGLFCCLIWLPVNPDASRRSTWSPWPTWSAKILSATGLEVRDYEVDGHRLSLHNHDR